MEEEGKGVWKVVLEEGEVEGVGEWLVALGEGEEMLRILVMVVVIGKEDMAGLRKILMSRVVLVVIMMVMGDMVDMVGAL